MVVSDFFARVASVIPLSTLTEGVSLCQARTYCFFVHIFIQHVLLERETHCGLSESLCSIARLRYITCLCVIFGVMLGLPLA